MYSCTVGRGGWVGSVGFLILANQEIINLRCARKENPEKLIGYFLTAEADN